MRTIKGLVLICALLCTPQFAKAASDEYVITFQSFYGAANSFNILLDNWLKDITEQSKGRLVFEFTSNAAITGPEGALPGLIKGTIDSGNFAAALGQDMGYSFSGFLPFVTKNSVDATKLFWKLYDTVPAVKESFDKKVVLLSSWSTDRIAFASIKGPIKSPNDLKGKRVLVWGSGGSINEELKAYGATAVPVSVTDTYVALQRGMGDVAYGMVTMLNALKLSEVAKDWTILESGMAPMFIGVNKDVWNDLPEDLQQLWKDNAGMDMAIKYSQLQVDQANKDIEQLRAAGCNVFIPEGTDLEPFKSKVLDPNGSVMAYWKKTFKQENIDNPEEWIKKVYEMAITE